MKFESWRGYSVVFGAFLIQLTLGTIYTSGNLGPYLISYVRVFEPSVNLSVIVWILSIQALCQGLLMVPNGYLSTRIGQRYITVLGCFLMSGGVAVTFFTIDVSFEVFLLTYGVLFGLGVSMAYVPSMTCAMLWFPEHRGKIYGIVVGGFGFGPFIINQVQTHFLNPSNLPPNHDGYFTQKIILDKVPYLFLLLGGTYLTLQIIGFLLIKEVNEERPVVEQVQSNEGTENVPPLQVLKSKTFYLLWLTFFFNMTVVTFVMSTYKAFGQTFIKDDQYLAIVGSLSAAVNGGGRILWGILMDKASYKISMSILCASVCALLFTLPLTSHAGKAMYTVWICLLFFSMGGTFTIMPTATSQKFGSKYIDVNYGMVFSNVVIATPVTAALTETLIGTLHYNGMFFLLGGLSFISLLLTFFDKTT